MFSQMIVSNWSEAFGRLYLICRCIQINRKFEKGFPVTKFQKQLVSTFFSEHILVDQPGQYPKTYASSAITKIDNRFTFGFGFTDAKNFRWAGRSPIWALSRHVNSSVKSALLLAVGSFQTTQ